MSDADDRDPRDSAHERARDERARGPFGPLEDLDDVQRQAFDAAMRVASELRALGGDLADSSWLGENFGAGVRAGGSGSARPGDAPFDVGRLRGDVVRAAETFSELMRSLLDVGFDAMDELARRPVARPGATAPPGAIARVECVVSNDEGTRVTGARPIVAPLVSARGESLDAAIQVHPEALDLAAHERTTVTIEVHVSPIAEPGRYHGLLLVSGLADVATAVTVTVAAPVGGDHDDH